jgi:hypothetical protein
MLDQLGIARPQSPLDEIRGSGHSQEDVGGTARLSRHPARQLLQAFEARGWISQSYRCIHILAPDQLRALVDSGEAHGLSF